MDSRAERIERMARELLNTTWVREREKSPGSGAAEALRAALAQPSGAGDARDAQSYRMGTFVMREVCFNWLERKHGRTVALDFDVDMQTTHAEMLRAAPAPRRICPLCESRWERRYEGGVIIDYCPKCAPAPEKERP